MTYHRLAVAPAARLHMLAQTAPLLRQAHTQQHIDTDDASTSKHATRRTPATADAARAAADAATQENASSPFSPFLDESGKLRAVSFSGAGWLLVYHLGVLDALRTLKLLGPSTVFAGASAGSLVACAAAGDLPTTALMDCYITMGEQCRRDKRWLRGKAGVYLNHALDMFVSDDLHLQLDGRALVAVTLLNNPRKPVLFDHFHSRTDLVEALTASCFVPLYLNGHLHTHFRQQRAIDGGIPRLIPSDPVRLAGAVNVCPFPRSVTACMGSTVHIGPHLQSRVKLGLSHSVLTAFKPPAESEAHILYQVGHASAVAFAQEALLPPRRQQRQHYQHQQHYKHQQHQPHQQQHEQHCAAAAEDASGHVLPLDHSQQRRQ
ncbi:hypothetical protein PTSG_03690 [Salpingoeca rosetta]|uniref:PNPLA domain-containing protein n=1 Tax=Salpingoeca rosetta (strain ATCC 50818 / BSB-021) TaxID=946362 RepID=F2U6B1_SALR5|nr:uncharacterized protein PTSG_03690 [Salpingoeca rosetta]EGD83052.1 hypothetical protein PTSG_03690 [Salpingoeca rosetta]|eukprot:XP_004995416.1 hypothetical protein PTSG_03690 [Salpingoeca rosetta]